MCPPASPHKGASIVKFLAHNACVFGMETPLRARVAPQGRIHHSPPTHNACVFGMETPLRERPGGHAGTAPTVSFGWIACEWLFCLCEIAWKNMVEMGGGGAYVPTCFTLSKAHSTIF